MSMQNSALSSFVKFGKSTREWLPFTSFVGLLIGYLMGFWYYYIYFTAFKLNIADFLSASDYLGIAIDHIDFVCITLLFIVGTPVIVAILASQLAGRMSESFPSVAIHATLAVAMIFAVLIGILMPSVVANHQAQLIIDGKGNVFDIYLNQNNEIIKDCGFIAATSKFTFCYDYTKKMPNVIGNISITKMVMTKAAESEDQPPP